MGQDADPISHHPMYLQNHSKNHLAPLYIQEPSAYSYIPHVKVDAKVSPPGDHQACTRPAEWIQAPR